MTMMVIDLNQQVSAKSLALFRIAFGALLTFSCLRYMANGWIDTQLVMPQYHFTFWFADGVAPLSLPMMYAIIGGLAVLGICISAGLWYRVSCVLFAIGWTYIELIDKTYYLNHYYYISLMTALMAMIPMHRCWSLDAQRYQMPETISLWMLHAVRVQVAVVYVYAGVAKAQPDWLVHAQPLRIWLGGQGHLPVVGAWITQQWVAHVASWAGCLFDLTIVGWLLWRPTRRVAYVAVIAFHVITWSLFPIGVFPWVMIVSATVFFSPSWCSPQTSDIRSPQHMTSSRLSAFVVAVWCVIQILVPLRSHLYPGDVLWHEQGFRFSWRVMLVEKAGMVEYEVRRGERRWTIYPREWLTPTQVRMMSTQPDMILQFAHHLADVATVPGQPDVEVYAHAWVAAQGRPSARLIDPRTDLARQTRGLANKPWILKKALTKTASTSTLSRRLR